LLIHCGAPPAAAPIWRCESMAMDGVSEGHLLRARWSSGDGGAGSATLQ